MINGLKQNGIYPKEIHNINTENVTIWSKKNNHKQLPNPASADSLEDFVKALTKKIKHYLVDPKTKSHIGVHGFTDAMDKCLINYCCQLCRQMFKM